MVHLTCATFPPGPTRKLPFHPWAIPTRAVPHRLSPSFHRRNDGSPSSTHFQWPPDTPSLSFTFTEERRKEGQGLVSCLCWSKGTANEQGRPMPHAPTPQPQYRDETLGQHAAPSAVLAMGHGRPEWRPVRRPFLLCPGFSEFGRFFLFAS